MIRWITRIFIGLCLACFFVLALTNLWVYTSTSGQIHEDIDSIPFAPVGIVLGTSPLTVYGTPNPYFESRMEAAVALFRGKKIRHILVSGDNGGKYYNEPLRMQQALLDAGIPETAITIDNKGFRTLDSMIRCSEVFNQDQVTVITQSFHAHRALFIGNHLEMDVQAFAANKVAAGRAKVTIREYFARSLAVWDLYFAGNGEKYSGKTETL